MMMYLRKGEILVFSKAVTKRISQSVEIRDSWTIRLISSHYYVYYLYMNNAIYALCVLDRLPHPLGHSL